MYLYGVYDPSKPVVIDIETIRFDDKTPAFDPFTTPARMQGVAICSNFENAAYFPFRHRTDTQNVLNIDEFLKEFREFTFECKHIVNQNIKFDLHFMEKDGVVPGEHTRLTDIQVMGRYFKHDLMSYSLDAMGKLFCKNFTKSDEVKKWVKEHKTQDYGMVPIEMMRSYAKLDVLATLELYHFFSEKLSYLDPKVLEYEDQLTRILWDSERTGVKLDTSYLKNYKFEALCNALQHMRKIHEICGPDFNPSSPVQVRHFFEANNYFSEKKTKAGGLSYDADFLETVALDDIKGDNGAPEVARRIIKYNEETHNESTYCSGWVSQVDEKGLMHGQFRQSGTKTGRMSMGAPTLHNFPPWAKRALIIPEGKVGVKFDYSQIEYRQFTHYSGNKLIINKYLENPLIDYHGLMAEILGLPRSPCKTMNFAIIYGVGKEKLATYLANYIIEKDSSELREKLEKFHTGDIALSEYEIMPADVVKQIGYKVRQYFLDKNPAIQELNSMIRTTLRRRGYIKNMYGRRYSIPDSMAYMGLNYLCQGSAADFVKRRIADILNDPDTRKMGISGRDMMTTVHDSLFMEIPEPISLDFIEVVKRHAVKSPLSIPIAIDVDLCYGNWKNEVKYGSFYTQPDQYIKEAA